MSTIALQPAAIPSPALPGSLQSALYTARRAQRLYQSSAQLCQEAGLYVAAHAFRFTAAQEAEHAAVLEGLLRSCSRSAPPDEGTCPPSGADPYHLLQTAARDERRQAGRLSQCAALAAQAGLLRLAIALERIADTELTHALRFGQYADVLSSGTLFSSPTRTSWFCLHCGLTHYGQVAPESCSACGHGDGGFIRTSFAPFAVRR